MSLGLRNGVTSPENYVRGAFEAECSIAASTGAGRNEQLNRSSFAIGQLIPSGYVDRGEAEARLLAAAHACGYVRKDGAPAATATIKSGLDEGMRKPRDIPSNGAAAEPIKILRPAPKLDDVSLPDMTPPGEDGRPKLYSVGKTEPARFAEELRRHVYWRDGRPVRVRIKNTSGSSPAWLDTYRVRRPTDGAIGWQAKKPVGFVPVPYVGPAGTASPFGPEHIGEVLVWAEGEKDVDTLLKHGFLAFTFGSASDVPDCHDLVRSHHIIICVDNDPAGEKSVARKVAAVQGAAASVKLVQFPELEEGGDATDFFDAGNTAEDFLDRAKTVDASTTEPPREPPSDPVTALVERFNAKYMLVNETGKAVILQPAYDPVLKRKRHDRLTLKDLQALYMNEMIEVGRDDKNRPIHKTAADVWLKHPQRRQYINGIAFDPTNAEQEGVLNLWEGFSVPPVQGDWSLMRSHIHDVICDGDEIRFGYLMGWMARMLQQPAEQGEVAVVMRGGEGAGKGSLAKALMRIVGHHGLAIANAKHLVGNFNSHLRDVIFLFADEAFFAGDRSHIGALKSLITEPHLPLEGKFQNVVLAPNFLHLMMASNEEWVVPASLDARRFFVLEVPDRVKGDHAYFGRIWTQMDAGGYAAMLHDLLAYDLTTFNVRSVPTTEGLQYQRKLSLPTTEAWWLDCLERGYVFKSKIGLHDEFGHWHEVVTTELLFASYMAFVDRKNERRPLTREHLGKFLISVGGVACRKRQGIIGEQIADVKNDFGNSARKAEPIRQDRATAYNLGVLAAARLDFAKTLNINLPWDQNHPPDED